MKNFYSFILRSFNGEGKTQKNECHTELSTLSLSKCVEVLNSTFYILNSKCSTLNLNPQSKLFALLFAFSAIIGGVWGQSPDQTYNSGSGSFTVPAGVSAIQVKAWGGGGGGGGSNSNGSGGSGGGSGAYTVKLFSVSSGQQYAYSVGGAGAAGAAAGGTGGNGGATTFTGNGQNLSAGGGSGGAGNAGAVGSGGVSSGGETGSSDGNSGSQGGSSGGNGGSAPNGGSGGAGYTNAAGSSGNTPGGGGGGGERNGGSSLSGGIGGAGRIEIYYFYGPTISSLSSSSYCSVGGQTVTITGSNFTGATAVTFNGVSAASFSVTNSTTISAVTPANVAAGVITVTTPAGSASSSSYTVTTAPSEVTVTGGGTVCNSTTLTASGGTGGTIYWQNTTNNGTSTSTASSSQSISASGTYYFRAQSAAGCWGTEGSAAVTVNTSPVISSNPVSVVTTPGSNISFSVTASASPTSYTWQNSNDNGVSWTTIEANSVYTNVTTSTLNVSNALPSMNGLLFRVLASNTCGNSAYSSSALLTVSYCVPTATTDNNCGITRVIFNTIDNTSTGASAYTDFKAQSTTVTRGSSFNLTVNVNTAGNVASGARVWIDWNKNLLFEGGEEYSLGTAQNVTNNSTSLSPLSITVPVDAVLGNTVMRIRVANNVYPTPCDNVNNSEAEDYTLNVTVANATISTFTPASACPASTVTINGTGFSEVSSVKFNGTEAVSFQIISSTQITAIVPNATSGNISVTNPNGTVQSSGSFTVSSAPTTPTVTVTGSSSINVGGTSSLSATTSGGELNWYDQFSGGSVINTGLTYNLPTQCSSGTKTFYVEEVGSGSCNSLRGSVSIEVRPIISSNPSNALICNSGGSVTLSAQLTGGSSITWSPNTNLTATSGSSTVASPTSTIQYSMSASVVGCGTINSTQNVGVIQGLTISPTATPSSTCEGGTSSLNSNISNSSFSSSSISLSFSSSANATSSITTLSNNGTGTTLTSGNRDDGGWGSVPIGFNFKFFSNNVTYNTINVGTNGLVQFGTYNGGSSGGLGDYLLTNNLPSASEPLNMIAASASDLNATSSGSIRVWTEGISPTRTCIIEWNNVPGFTSGTSTAQIKLFETTGNVEVHVQNNNAIGYNGVASKVVGLQNSDASVGVTALNTTSTITNQAWRFIPGANYAIQWSTAGSNIESATSGTYTTPALNTPGTVTYTVAATNPNTQCASTANVSVTVNARPAAPNSTGDVSACSNAGSQNLTVTTYTDVTADWYNATTGGTLLTNNNLTHATSSAGTYYAESQNTVTGCTSTSRTAVTLNVNTSPNAPTVTTPVTYCQGATASALTATAGVGNILKWYTAAPNFPSVTGATLTGSAPIPSTSTAASTDYFVSQTAGACESQLAKIVVTVNASPATPTASDPSAYCQNASTTQLTATAAANCTLYWYSDPTTSAGQTTTAPTPVTTTAGTFYFYVANRNNTTSCEGSRKTITVTVNPSISASVTNSASSTSACSGGSITFTATPTNGGASPTYQWYLNNVAAGTNSPTYVLASPASGNVIKVTMTPSAQTCLSNPGESNSNTITLTSAASTPTVTIQSTSSSAICPGTSVTFSVNSSTNMGATPGYVWKKGGVAISGATSSTYTTTGLVNGDQITLEMSSSLSSECLTQPSATSSAITTTVNSATAISSQPVATAACLGSSANFSVTASGQGTLTYQWKKGGVNITGNATAITNSLTLSGIVAGDAANYSVDVTGACGTVPSSSVALSINTATSISTQPDPFTDCAGTTANFSVTATGQGSLTYDWRKDGVSINGATSSTLAVINISSSNAGQYSVIVTGGCGSVTSSNALLTVNAATAIATHPSASTLCAGNTANFSVTATGTGSLTYQWKRDGTNVGTGSTLSVSNAQSANAGTYTVEVSGTCGTAISNGALLTVNPITSITTQPTASAGCEGQNTTFTVVAAGTAPLSYQWKFGGNNIVGATSSTYNISSTTNANDGSYFVTITGGCGTVNSSAVNLTVYPTPTANAGADQTVCPGEMITLSGSGVTSGTYTWNNSVQNGVVFAAPASTTTYTVTGTSPQGCPDTDEILVTIKDKPTVSIGGTTTICIATSTTLTASGTVGNTYSWSNGSITAGNTVSPSSTTSYTVTATGTNGCTNTATQSVTVNTPSIPYPISGKEYYIWRGAISSDYLTPTNWYFKGTNDVWSIATQAPQDMNSVIIPSGTCATQSPVITANSSTSDSLIVLSGATLSFSGSPTIYINNDVIVRSGGTLSLGNGGAVMEITDGSLKLLGNSTFTPGNGTIKFHNTTNHPEGHTLICESASNNTFYKLDFHGDQNANDFVLGSNINVTNELKLTSSNFKLNNYYVDLGTTGVLTEGSNGKKVYDIGSGYVTAQKNILADGTSYNPGNLGFSIQASSGKPLGNTEIRRYHIPVTTDLDGMGSAVSRYYKVTPQFNGGSGNTYTDGLNATVTFSYNNVDLASTSHNESTLALYRKGTGDSQWQQLEGSLSTNNKTLTVTNFPRFSDVTLGGGGSPLPVELVSFSGACEEGIINLTWQTASEFNSSHFDVEKSRDGENWQLLTTLPSAGTSNELITYQSSDQNGTEGNNYFRLRQVDNDGAEKLYDPINVSCSEVTAGYFSSFPNPSGNAFQVILNNKELVGACTMNIVDATGKVIEKREVDVKDGINMFVVNQELTPGIYFLNISNGAKSTPVLRHAIK